MMNRIELMINALLYNKKAIKTDFEISLISKNT